MKYYALMDQSLHGPFDAEALTTLPNFTRRTLVQMQERFDSDYSRWTEAGDVPLLAVLMDTRDRGATHARSAAALDAYSAARRANERDIGALRREVVEGVQAQRAAMEGAREDLAKVVVRIADVETALKDIKKAICWGVAVGGAVGLALLARSWTSPRPGAVVPPVQDSPAPKAVLEPPAPLPPPAAVQATREPEPAKPAPVAAPKPVPPPDAEGEAVALVKGAALPAAGVAPCPRSLEELLQGGAGPARTAPERADCRAVARFAALRASLVGQRGWTEGKAVGLLTGVVKAKGGFDAVFPPYASVRRQGAGAYEVELGRRDLLTPAVSVLLNSDLPAEDAGPDRYAADLKARSVKPLEKAVEPHAPAPAPSPEDEGRAIDLVRTFLLPNPEASRCPRTVEEALEGRGGPARTPQEVVDCRAVSRFMAIRSALSQGKRWSRRKASKFLNKVMAERGGFEAVFPPYAAARKLEGRAYAVELGRRDLLTPTLSVMLELDIPADGAAPVRFQTDLETRSVRPPSEP